MKPRPHHHQFRRISKFTDSPELVVMRSRFHEPWHPVFSVKDGWRDLLIACEKSLSIVDNHYRLMQVKEKFGALRIYATASDKGLQLTIDKVCDYASAASGRICEDCGALGHLRRSNVGHFFTACDEHSHGREVINSHYVFGVSLAEIQHDGDVDMLLRSIETMASFLL
jgi:hypothetical protein